MAVDDRSAITRAQVDQEQIRGQLGGAALDAEELSRQNRALHRQRRGGTVGEYHGDSRRRSRSDLGPGSNKEGKVYFHFFPFPSSISRIIAGETEPAKLTLTKGHQGGRQRGGLRPALPSDPANETGESSLQAGDAGPDHAHQFYGYERRSRRAAIRCRCESGAPGLGGEQSRAHDPTEYIQDHAENAGRRSAAQVRTLVGHNLLPLIARVCRVNCVWVLHLYATLFESLSRGKNILYLCARVNN